jgi:hypothetical protein
MTRCIAIVPSLVVAIIGGSSGAGRLIIIASVRHIPPSHCVDRVARPLYIRYKLAYAANCNSGT